MEDRGAASRDVEQKQGTDMQIPETLGRGLVKFTGDNAENTRPEETKTEEACARRECRKIRRQVGSMPNKRKR